MKCRYCGKEIDKEYCGFECRKAYLDYSDDIDKFAEKKKPMLIASVLISVPVMILFFGAGVTLMFALLGLTLITHPYPSDKTKKKLYPKDAMKLMRTIGVILIIIGLPFLLLTGTWLEF